MHNIIELQLMLCPHAIYHL